MKVIASAIAAALTTTTATVSLAAVVAIAPVATESAQDVFQAPLSAEIVSTVSDWDFNADATAALVADAVAEAAAEPEPVVEPEAAEPVAEPEPEPVAEPVAEPEAAEPEPEPVLSIAHTGEGDSKKAPVMTPGTINVSGNVMGYIDYFEAPAAPEHGAGLWLGSESTTDGSWGYFIGHNPGDFSAVMDLQGGDAVTVCDRAGNSRTYYVVDAFTVTTETYWSDIESRVTGYGESIIVQTCCGDNLHYRVVVCA